MRVRGRKKDPRASRGPWMARVTADGTNEGAEGRTGDGSSMQARKGLCSAAQGYPTKVGQPWIAMRPGTGTLKGFCKSLTLVTRCACTTLSVLARDARRVPRVADEGRQPWAALHN